ncbi:MAG: DM13 domain-containing protein [Bacteroidota bacterium]
MKFICLLLTGMLLTGCIGDDIIFDTVEETVRISNPIDSLQVGDTFQFTASYLNNIGVEENQTILWSSSDPSKASIAEDGTATGIELGQTQIIARVELPTKTVADSMLLNISNTTTTPPAVTERSGSIVTTSSYLLQGDFTLREDNGDLILEFDSNYAASSALPGLYVYLTNNPNTNNNAFEIGEVTTFSGAHSYIISGIELNQYDYLLYYCKPFSVKVGDGDIE